VVWHQDTALPLRERRDAPGWGPWSVKDGIAYAHAPASALSKVLAIRIRVHLDNSDASNGPLRVLPRTHVKGILSDGAIEQLVQRSPVVDCLVPKGGVLAMRPLIVHAWAQSRATGVPTAIALTGVVCVTLDRRGHQSKMQTGRLS